tara:strand:- start:514 stop:786 length:273 start_codon:yes stop_codon:yes gene_type:complete
MGIIVNDTNKKYKFEVLDYILCEYSTLGHSDTKEIINDKKLLYKEIVKKIKDKLLKIFKNFKFFFDNKMVSKFKKIILYFTLSNISIIGF